MSEKRSRVRSILADQSLLEYVPPIEIDRLAAVATTATYEAEQWVFRQGEPGNAAMSVIRGRVRVSTRSAEDREVVLAVLGQGEFLGEIATIDGGDRTADAVAMEPTELLVIGRDAFVSFLERNPQASLRLLRLFCERFRWTDEAISDLNIFNLRPRLAKRLLSLCEQYGDHQQNALRVALRLPEKTLAGMMGSTREAVRRQLRQWAEAGLIEFDEEGLLVRDTDGLKRVVLKLDTSFLGD